MGDTPRQYEVRLRACALSRNPPASTRARADVGQGQDPLGVIQLNLLMLDDTWG